MNIALQRQRFEKELRRYGLSAESPPSGPSQPTPPTPQPTPTPPPPR